MVPYSTCLGKAVHTGQPAAFHQQDRGMAHRPPSRIPLAGQGDGLLRLPQEFRLSDSSAFRSPLSFSVSGGHLSRSPGLVL